MDNMEIIDSHAHWGPSVALFMTVTTEEILRQAESCGVDRVVIFPFPSQALDDEMINEDILEESRRVDKFIPYYYIPDDLRSIPLQKGYYGAKWHWTRGIQDCSSNYDVLSDPRLAVFIEESQDINLPIIMEEELEFTETFVKKSGDLKIIIPHMGMLGGDPLEFLNRFRHNENVFFDTALAGQSTVAKFKDKIGPERILFGSDIPFGSMKSELNKILSLSAGDGEKELILSRNIRRLIGFE
ncbi:MAG: amidohydrolase family protein [Deltaproteobacteria bacterium]|nr:amidohydrolase family protein [Deltaproteobacteria bacterium]